MDPHDRNAWEGSGVAGALKSFWAAVKAATRYRKGVRKVFLTGISPLLLTHLSAGFNIAENISFDPHFATVCGLTKHDVLGALRLVFKNDKEKVQEEKVQEHLAKLEKYTNGYHFCNFETVPTVFNPDTVMWYLKVIFLKQLVLNPVLISFSTQANTEANRQTLSILRIPKSRR